MSLFAASYDSINVTREMESFLARYPHQFISEKADPASLSNTMDLLLTCKKEICENFLLKIFLTSL